MSFAIGRALALATLAVVAGVASASALVPGSGPDVAEAPQGLQPDGGAATLGSTASDPVGGLDWAVRVYTSTTGETCPELGRVFEGRFGHVDGPAGFTELPVDSAGSCADLERAIAAFAVNRYPKTADQGARVALFGVASSTVRTVAFQTASGVESLSLDHQSFLVVRPGLALDGTLVFTTADGKPSSYPLSPPGSPPPPGARRLDTRRP